MANRRQKVTQRIFSTLFIFIANNADLKHTARNAWGYIVVCCCCLARNLATISHLSADRRKQLVGCMQVDETICDPCSRDLFIISLKQTMDMSVFITRHTFSSSSIVDPVSLFCFQGGKHRFETWDSGEPVGTARVVRLLSETSTSLSCRERYRGYRESV